VNGQSFSGRAIGEIKNVMSKGIVTDSREEYDNPLDPMCDYSGSVLGEINESDSQIEKPLEEEIIRI
jgi:hypothetical protein